MLSREVVILARCVDAQCYDARYCELDAKGHSAAAYAMWALKERGLIGEMDGIGRVIRGKWRYESWKQFDGMNSDSPDQEIIDNICFMINQFSTDGQDNILVRVTSFRHDIWRESIEFLSDLGVVKITNRFKEAAKIEDLWLLKSWYGYEGNHSEFEIEALDAEFVDKWGFFRRRYPEVDWDKHL